MNHFYTYLALQFEHDRALSARNAYHAAQLRQRPPARTSIVRHGLANGMAALSRASAAIARRLDGCVADDLGGRNLAPTE